MRFYAVGGPVAGFECRLDHGRYRSCRSPARYPRIGHGVHAIQVRAVGVGGLHGPAAVRRFYVGRYRPSRHTCLGGLTELPPRHR